MIYLAYMQAELTEARSRIIDPTDWVPHLSAHPELLRSGGMFELRGSDPAKQRP